MTLDQYGNFQASGTKTYILRLDVYEEVQFYITYWLSRGALNSSLRHILKNEDNMGASERVFGIRQM